MEMPVSEEDWQARNTLMKLSASELNILLSTPAIPTMVGPEMVMRQVSSMEDMPAMGAVPWLHSRLITVPLAAGLKVFLTTISMFFVKAG